MPKKIICTVFYVLAPLLTFFLLLVIAPASQLMYKGDFSADVLIRFFLNLLLYILVVFILFWIQKSDLLPFWASGLAVFISLACCLVISSVIHFIHQPAFVSWYNSKWFPPLEGLMLSFLAIDLSFCVLHFFKK